MGAPFDNLGDYDVLFGNPGRTAKSNVSTNQYFKKLCAVCGPAHSVTVNTEKERIRSSISALIFARGGVPCDRHKDFGYMRRDVTEREMSKRICLRINESLRYIVVTPDFEPNKAMRAILDTMAVKTDILPDLEDLQHLAQEESQSPTREGFTVVFQKGEIPDPRFNLLLQSSRNAYTQAQTRSPTRKSILTLVGAILEARGGKFYQKCKGALVELDRASLKHKINKYYIRRPVRCRGRGCGCGRGDAADDSVLAPQGVARGRPADDSDLAPQGVARGGPNKRRRSTL